MLSAPSFPCIPIWDFNFRIPVCRPFLAQARAWATVSSSKTLCLHCCRVCGGFISYAIMQMLAWLSIAMISSCSWPMSRRVEAIAASLARVMMFVAPGPLGLIDEKVPLLRCGLQLQSNWPRHHGLAWSQLSTRLIWHTVSGWAWLGSYSFHGQNVSMWWAVSLPWLLVFFSKALKESCDLMPAAVAACTF